MCRARIRESGKGRSETGPSLHLVQKNWPWVLCLLLLAFEGTLHAQDGSDDAAGFGDVTLGSPVGRLPFPCVESAVCEGFYNSAWVRVHHADGRVQRVDVVYSGKRAADGGEIRSTAMTLPQAIRSHSIRYGGLAPRLGLAGNTAGHRMIVDVANGVAYVANGAFVSSTVAEVWYLPVTDAAVAAAMAAPLSHHGDWLVKAARSAPRYKNLLAEESGTAPGRDRNGTTPEEVPARLARMSSEVKSYAEATLMLSAHVSECLKNHQQPDPALAARLRRAYALLRAAEGEAASLIKDHAKDVSAEERELVPLQLAGEADSRMQELVSEGFVE